MTLAGIFVVLFVETGLLAGFFLPGDSLLFTAGALAAAGRLSLPLVMLVASAGAACGAQTGYVIGRVAGRLAGPRLDTAFARGERLLTRFGIGRTMILARFIPVVRTVINPLAGTAGVPLRTFAIWQTAGAMIWSAGTSGIGYLAARLVPGITHVVVPTVVILTAISLIAAAFHAARRRRNQGNTSPIFGSGTRRRFFGIFRHFRSQACDR
jgi:membrane-associated protein